MTSDQIAQLGLSAIFAAAAVQLFLRLQGSQSEFLKYLIEQNALLRKQNVELQEQNKLLSLALFSNNPDAMRAYSALAKTYPPSHQTDLGESVK